jgi:hypothetical protein
VIQVQHVGALAEEHCAAQRPHGRPCSALIIGPLVGGVAWLER